MIFKKTLTSPTAYTAFLIITTIAVGMLSISHQSFWMDEGGPAFKSLMPTFKDWWLMTMRLGGSDTQMPVYMFLLWVWEKLGAGSEYTMRAINIPWLLLAVLILKRVPFWPLVCLTSPFLLYYTGELRPYAMQIAAGSMAAAALIEVASARKVNEFSGVHLAAGAALLLASSSLTGAVWAFGLWIGIVIIRPAWLMHRGFWFRISPWALAAMIVGGYYVFTLLQGYRAAAVAGGGIASVMFGIYEMIGLLGLGPGKNELRESIKSITSFLPIIIPSVMCFSGAWICGINRWMKSVSSTVIIGVSSVVLIPIAILTLTGIMMDFRVLGRHLSPALPAILLPIALSFSGSGVWKISSRAFGIIAVCLSLTSAVILRYSIRHSRDDFRTASTLALEAMKRNEIVWWQADMNCMRYYAYLQGGIPLINAVQSLESDAPTSLLTTDYIIINRPDLKYPGIDYQKDFLRNSFKLERKLNGFEIWTANY